MANFAELLEKSGHTQAWVCQLTGASRQVVNNWYTGRTKKIPEEHRSKLEEFQLWPTPDEPSVKMMPEDAFIAATEIIMEVCREAGKHAETLNSRALGRLLVLLAKKVEQGDGEAARGAALAEARDWVAGLAASPAP